MNKLLQTILLISAYTLLFPLLWLNKRVVRQCYGSTSGYDYSIAYKIDVFANHNFAPFWNYHILANDSKHHFGHNDESLSSVLGKNQLDGSLTKNGDRLRKIVDWSDKSVKNHCVYHIRKDIEFKHIDFEKFKK